MIVNSPSRLSKRRKEALVRRTTDLKTWEGKLGADADNKELQAKVECAKNEVAILNKKVGSVFS